MKFTELFNHIRLGNARVRPSLYQGMKGRRNRDFNKVMLLT